MERYEKPRMEIVEFEKKLAIATCEPADIVPCSDDCYDLCPLDNAS